MPFALTPRGPRVRVESRRLRSDDNELRTRELQGGGLLHALLAPELRTHHALLNTSHYLYNPYPDFAPSLASGKSTFLWPRGFPLDFIRDPSTYAQPASRRGVEASSVQVCLRGQLQLCRITPLRTLLNHL